MKDKGVPSLDNARKHYYDNAADKYETRRANKAKWQLEDKHLKELLGLVQERSTVLDVPVGTGRFLQLYADKGFHAVGVDYSEAMLEHARTKHPNAILEKGDITSLRFANGSFDVVVCVRMLHLVAPHEVSGIMRELLRVARRHVIVTLHLDKRPYIRGRSQVHTAQALAACVPEGWGIYSSNLLLEEKGMPYYMVHIAR